MRNKEKKSLTIMYCESATTTTWTVSESSLTIKVFYSTTAFDCALFKSHFKTTALSVCRLTPKDFNSTKDHF